MLKPQDIIVLLKVIVMGKAPWTISSLAKSLHMSASEVHGALSRAEHAGLYAGSKRRPNRTALREFLAHGIRYAFAPERSTMTRGIPTAHSAPVLESLLQGSDSDVPLVWPDPHGEVRGIGIKPLYRTGPKAALEDDALYRLLALVDALRVGGARERRVALEVLDQELRA